VLPVFLILFILVPIAELWLLIKIGGEIGVVPTLALLIFDSLVGAALVRSQSRVAWDRFNRALAAGRVPGREVFDGAMIIMGGALLLAPGFLTDAVGLILLLPPTNAAIRAFLVRSVSKRAGVAWRVGGFATGAASRRAGGSGSSEYDYEGTATEVTDPPPALPDAGEGDGRG